MLLFKQPRKSLSQKHSLMIPWFTLFLEKPLPESPLYWKAIPHSPSTASADLPPLEHNVKNSSLRKSTEIVTLSKRENSPFSQHPHQVTSASCIWSDEFWTKHSHMGAPNFSHLQTRTQRCCGPWGNKCAYFKMKNTKPHTIIVLKHLHLLKAPCLHFAPTWDIKRHFGNYIFKK